jgi:hypothetical protein
MASSRSSSSPVNAKWPRWAEVVGAELQFEAVPCGGLRRHHHARVVDEQVDVVVPRTQVVGGVVDRLQRGQIEFLQRNAGTGDSLSDERGGVFALVEVSHSEHDMCALRSEGCGGLIPQTRVGFGDDIGAAGLVGDVVRGPLGHRVS